MRSNCTRSPGVASASAGSSQASRTRGFAHEVTRGVQMEFIVRDVYTVHGDLGNARRAVEIARREIDRYYQP